MKNGPLPQLHPSEKFEYRLFISGPWGTCNRLQLGCGLRSFSSSRAISSRDIAVLKRSSTEGLAANEPRRNPVSFELRDLRKLAEGRCAGSEAPAEGVASLIHPYVRLFSGIESGVQSPPTMGFHLTKSRVSLTGRSIGLERSSRCAAGLESGRRPSIRPVAASVDKA